MRLFLIGLLVVLLPGSVKAQFSNAVYTSGYLAADPETNENIDSPFLAFSSDDFQWIAYDPEARGGRFLDTKSSATGVISGGFITGDINFLGEFVEAPSGKSTAIAVNVKPTKEVNWIHIHQSAFGNSRVHAVHKLKDGHAILSGYEFDDDETRQKAFLMRIDRQGQIRWHKEIDHAIGYGLQENTSGHLFWMFAQKGSDKNKYQSQISRLDPKTGELIHSISEERFTEGILGWKDMTLSITDDQSILTTRSVSKPDGLLVTRYTPGGLTLWSQQVMTGNRLDVFPKGTTEWPSGNLLVAAGLAGHAMINEANDSLSVIKGEDMVLIQLDPLGNFLNHQQYGKGDALLNDVFRHQETVGIIGGLLDSLQVQEQVIPYPNLEHRPVTLKVLLDESYIQVKEDLNIPGEIADQVHALRIYPNPSNGAPVFVTYSQAVPEVAYEILVYDNQGKEMFKSNGLALQEQTEDQLLLTDWSSGVYHLFYRQRERIVGYGRFVLNQ